MRSSCLERRVCFDHGVEHRLDLKDAGTQSFVKCFSYVFNNTALQNAAQSQLYPVVTRCRKKGHPPPPSFPCKGTRVSPWGFRKHKETCRRSHSYSAETKGDRLLTGRQEQVMAEETGHFLGQQRGVCVSTSCLADTGQLSYWRYNWHRCW